MAAGIAINLAQQAQDGINSGSRGAGSDCATLERREIPRKNAIAAGEQSQVGSKLGSRIGHDTIASAY